MTRKNYQAIASVLAEVDVDHWREAMTVASIVHGLADVFARENDRFDRERFYAACGVGSDAS